MKFSTIIFIGIGILLFISICYVMVYSILQLNTIEGRIISFSDYIIEQYNKHPLDNYICPSKNSDSRLFYELRHCVINNLIMKNDLAYIFYNKKSNVDYMTEIRNKIGAVEISKSMEYCRKKNCVENPNPSNSPSNSPSTSPNFK